MSTETTRNPLTAEQFAANKAAIESFLRKAAISGGRGSVILMPEFIENQATKVWEPVMAGIGARPTKNNAAFLRLGKAVAASNGSNVSWKYLYTNLFGESADALADMVAYVDPNAVIGGAIKGVRVVTHESLVPFSKTNPARDAKMTPDGLACTFTGTRMVEDELVTYSQSPIYRRVQVFFADDEGNYAPNAVNILIEHTNKEELSTAARVRWNQSNNGNSNAIKDAAAAKMTGETPEVELAELKSIKAKDRTPEQKARIVALTEQIELAAEAEEA